MTKKINLPVLQRAMQFKPSSLDPEKRTIDISLGTGAPVVRYDFWEGEQYIEELSMDPAHVRMGRFMSGSAPLCKDHESMNLDGMLGVIRSADLREGELFVKAQFSSRADVEPYFQDVKEGIIQNASVGYRVFKYMDVTPPDSNVKKILAVDWEPFEGSLVPVGADAGAGVRGHSTEAFPCEIETRAVSAKGESMPEIEQTPAAPVVETNPGTVAAPAARSEEDVKKAERTRSLEITQAVRKAGLPVNFAEELIEKGTSADQARAQIIDKLAEKSDKTVINPVVTGGAPSNAEERNRSIEAALLHRHDPGKFKLEGDARQFRGMTLMEMARAILEAQGKRTVGMSKMEIATRAFEGTSDFPSLLANVANKTLRDAYQAAPQTFRPISKLNMAVDFKQMSRVQLSDAPSLELVNASGEVKRGALTDGKETYSLATYAKIVPINRQAIINDDTSAFTRIPALMGRAAADLESDTVWAIILANAAMGDGVTLFHATHKNLAAAGAAPAVTPMGAARAAMKLQKNLAGRPMNILPKYMIVDPNNESAAEQVIGPIVPNQSSSFNPFMGKLTILSEPRLTVASGAQPWYVAADPGQIDVIEISYLDGQEGVYLESKQGFDVDGIEIKARLDFAAKALDWRGLYKNPGV